MHGMTFEPTLTFGALLQFCGIVGVGLIYMIRMEGKLGMVVLRITRLEETVANLTRIDSRLATIEERLTNHVGMLTTAQRDISDLRRGNGWITRDRSGVEGEYP
jgi:hypothetical protein